MSLPAPWSAKIASALLILLLTSANALAADASFFDKVTWIYDGDTLKLEKSGKVRLIGIDTPEKEDSPRDRYFLRQGISRKALRKVAHAALRHNIATVKGKKVLLSFDEERRDRHGRLLAYATLPDGRLLNRVLIEKGLAAVYRRFEFRLKEDFLQAEKEARQKGVGLWKE